MFIAMNRFKVIPVSQADFERVWTTRDTHLREVPGFIEFHLVRGPGREDHVLYASHHDLAQSGRLRGMDEIGSVSPRPPERRPE